MPGAFTIALTGLITFAAVDNLSATFDMVDATLPAAGSLVATAPATIAGARTTAPAPVNNKDKSPTNPTGSVAIVRLIFSTEPNRSLIAPPAALAAVIALCAASGLVSNWLIKSVTGFGKAFCKPPAAKSIKPEAV